MLHSVQCDPTFKGVTSRDEGNYLIDDGRSEANGVFTMLPISRIARAASYVLQITSISNLNLHMDSRQVNRVILYHLFSRNAIVWRYRLI